MRLHKSTWTSTWKWLMFKAHKLIRTKQLKKQTHITTATVGPDTPFLPLIQRSGGQASIWYPWQWKSLAPIRIHIIYSTLLLQQRDNDKAEFSFIPSHCLSSLRPPQLVKCQWFLCWCSSALCRAYPICWASQMWSKAERQASLTAYNFIPLGCVFGRGDNLTAS